MPAKALDTYSLVFNEIPIQITIYKAKGEPVPTYHVSLLEVSDATRLIIEKIRQEVINVLGFGLISAGEEEGEERIKVHFTKKIMELMKEHFPELSSKDLSAMTNFIVLTSLGLGEIEFLLKDPNLEEIVVNNAQEPIWVYHKKFAWLKTSLYVRDENKIRHYSTTIGRNVDKSITILEPLLDAHLKTGDRVNATLKPVTTKGNTITIRKFSEKPWTITDFITGKTIDVETAALIWLATQYELSVFIVGGTGSGKTSALNVFAEFFPPNQRILSIEDTRELQLPQNLHWVPMETRMPNPEGKGEVTMLDLMVNSLRMRPDRIVVGEIRRKKEAEVLFEAIHTGHSVYATFHSSNINEAIVRLTNPPIDLPKALLASLSLLVVQHRNRRTGVRRTFQIAEITPEGEPNLLFQHNMLTDKMEKVNESKVFIETIKLYSGLSKEDVDKDLAEKVRILNWIVKNRINDVHKLGMVLADYYDDKQDFLKKIFGGKHH